MQDIIDQALEVNLDKRMKREELEIIAKWTEKFYKGGNTLEIGAYKGMTSYLLASIIANNQHEANSKHYIIDLFEVVGDTEWRYEEHPKELLINNLGEYAKYADVTQSYSLGVDSLYKVFGNHFDYVFIDGDHRHPVVLMELLMCEINCDKILGHDYGHPGVTKSVDQFCALRGYEVFKPEGQFGLFELIKK